MPQTRPDHKVLFTPGPTEVAPEVLREMSRPVIGHRGEEMQALIRDLVPRVRTLFGTRAHDIFLTACSATGLWEAAIRNCVTRRVLVPICGSFSERFYEVALACGVEADPLHVEWGRAVPAQSIADVLASGRYDAVALVHNETATGVTNPLAEIAEAVRRQENVLLLVDAVSSLGGLPVEVDRHGIDVCLASVQKCLALPPGFSLCAVSERAMQRSAQRVGKGYYFDFVRLKGFFDRNVPLATPSVSHMFALQSQLKRIEKEGFEARYARHRAMAEVVRGWAGDRFALFAAEGARSDTITCVRNTRGMNVAAFLTALAARGFGVSNGYGKLKEATFRVGHMGDHTVDGVKELLRVMDETLKGMAA
ncbi:MAG TPA: alanine--glyoxylate aminotransferase family protein [Candidatus Polarisedimenticolia bacterium]|nr:alanine--glyoxylate aminotransferase family protein [Candidatus Polarisedimenticolia bacterium]